MRKPLNPVIAISLLAFTIASMGIVGRVGAWKVDGLYNICLQGDDKQWHAVQTTKQQWEAVKKQGAFPYEGPSKDHRPPFQDEWCVDHVPTAPPPVPLPVATVPLPPPSPVPQAVAPVPTPVENPPYDDGFVGK
jgi:hypothetical protein